MNAMASSKKPNSCLCHYTSIDVVRMLLEEALASDDGTFTLHLSHLQMMNDRGEGNYLLNQFFTASKLKSELKNGCDSFISNNWPFIFSTIKNGETTNNGVLPLWQMYGDQCCGAFIRFKGNDLVQYIKSMGPSHEFNKCSYQTVTETKKRVKHLNSKIKNKEFDDKNKLFASILSEASLVKSKDWEFENEWRAVIFADAIIV